MIALIASYIFFVLAAICNAVMDNVAHHPSLSVLKDVWDGWWIRDWRVKYEDCDGDGLGDADCGRKKWSLLGITFNAPVQLLDGWHFSKMVMIIFLCASVTAVTFSKIQYIEWYWSLAYFVLLGTSWNFFFGLFYKRILRK